MPSQLRLVCMERSRFCQTMASEWQTISVVAHKMPWCALLTAVKNYKSWINTRLFLQDRDQDQDQDQMLKTKTTFTFCPRGASRRRPWFRGLHHWMILRLLLLLLIITTTTMKTALSETQTLRALAVVRFGHRPVARPLSQSHRQDRLQYTVPQLASAQCNNNHVSGNTAPASAVIYILLYSQQKTTAWYKLIINRNQK